MRVVFLGTPQFAVPSLRTLLASRYTVSAVFTQPDRPAGRGQLPQSPAVKTLAAGAGLPIYQPERIRHEENRSLLESLRPDFLVVVAYGQIIPPWLLQLPTVAPVNVHASLLPRYRGAAPVAWAILNGDSTTGVTTMWMEETLDTGPILMTHEVPIATDSTSGELEKLLSEVGADILVPTLDGLSEGTVKPIPQDSGRATLAPKITKEMAAASWSVDAKSLHNRIRAFNPWPVAVVEFRGQRMQLFRSRQPARRTDAPAGTLLEITPDGVVVACAAGTVIEILEVQLAGRRRVSGREFAAGARLRPGDSL